MSDFGLYQPASGSAMADPFSILSLLLPLYVQSEGGPEGMKNLNSLIQMMTGQNVADVFGMGQAPEMVLRPERRLNVAAQDFRGEVGETTLQDLLVNNTPPQEVYRRLRELYEINPDYADWVDATAGTDATTGEVNWNNLNKMLRDVVREEAQIGEEFRQAERQFIATEASRPRFGFEQSYGFDPEAVARQMIDRFEMPDIGSARGVKAPERVSEPAPTRRQKAEEKRGGKPSWVEESIPGVWGIGRREERKPRKTMPTDFSGPQPGRVSQQDYENLLRERHEKGVRSAIDERLAQTAPQSRPTADTQRVLQNLQMMMALRGAFGSQ